MIENNERILKNLNYTKKEMETLLDYDNLEELIVLLSSIYIKDIKKYLYENNYLLKEGIYQLAKTIATTFDNCKDFGEAKRLLTQYKYNMKLIGAF